MTSSIQKDDPHHHHHHHSRRVAATTTSTAPDTNYQTDDSNVVLLETTTTTSSREMPQQPSSSIAAQDSFPYASPVPLSPSSLPQHDPDDLVSPTYSTTTTPDISQSLSVSPFRRDRYEKRSRRRTLEERHKRFVVLGITTSSASSSSPPSATTTVAADEATVAVVAPEQQLPRDHHPNSSSSNRKHAASCGNNNARPERRDAEAMDEKKEDGTFITRTGSSSSGSLLFRESSRSASSSSSESSSSPTINNLFSTSTSIIALPNTTSSSSSTGCTMEEAVEVIPTTGTTTTTTTMAQSAGRWRTRDDERRNGQHVLRHHSNHDIVVVGGDENDQDRHQDSGCVLLTPPPPISRPLHHHNPVSNNSGNNNDENDKLEADNDDNNNIRYYRISYRGVVALLSEPHPNSTRHRKSGSYLGFGEIFVSTWEMPVTTDCIDTSINNSHDNDDDSCSGATTTTNTMGPPALTARRSCREWDNEHPLEEHPQQRYSENDEEEDDDDDAKKYFAKHGILAPPPPHGAAAVDSSPPRCILSSRNAVGGGGGSVSSMDTLQTRSTTTAVAVSPAVALAHALLPLAPQIPDYLPSTKPQKKLQQQHHAPHVDDATYIKSDNDHYENLVIRVDQLLTGGYAMDAPPAVALEDNIETPKRSNLGDLPDCHQQHYHHHHHHHLDHHQASSSARPDDDIGKRSVTVVPAKNDEPCAADQSSDGGGGVVSIGYLFSRRKGLTIVERIARKPKTEPGKFHYKIISPIPLPILTGPCLDAPKTKAMVLPGTLHEVSLRVTLMESNDDDDNHHETVYLRLAHRKGWIADRKVTSRKGQYPVQYKPVVRLISDDSFSSTGTTDDCSVVSSLACSTFIVAPGVAARRRHRPPRRRRDGAQGNALDKTLPRQIDGCKMSSNSNSVSTPVKTTSRGGASFSDAILTPTSIMSILSDDSSFDHSYRNNRRQQQQLVASPDVSFHSASHDGIHGTAHQQNSFYLIRVTAPRGLKILDAPHFQVNSLIRGTQQGSSSLFTLSSANSSSLLVSKVESSSLVAPPSKSHYSIFQTMSGGIAVASQTMTGNNPAIFDASMKTRILPRGAVFEASKRMESTGAYSQGAGLIKLSDNSGWAIVPRKDELDQQYRNFHLGVAGVKEGEASSAFEEVGHAIVESSQSTGNNDAGRVERSASNTVWIRVLTRPGVVVCCSPPPSNQTGDDSDTSPTSSRGSSAINGSHHESILGPMQSHDSDVTSSVASTFVDAMLFRTPKKKDQDVVTNAVAPEPPPRSNTDQHRGAIISCGMCVEAERWSEPAALEDNNVEFVRLAGGQGWIPIRHEGRTVASKVPRPDFRFGSFWFRVQSSRGIKVRLGPSKKSPSIKSDQGVHFRFECGEFLRASEIMTIFSSTGEPVESFAKLYRNRHVRLHNGHEDFRQLPSLTAQAEWVQVYSEKELYLDECAAEPRIERHKQGWKYIVVPENGIPVRKGPSFAAQTTGVRLSAGETVTVNERVTPSGDKIQWLRMKDGEGWLHDVSDLGEQVMMEHSLRHRAKVAQRPVKVSGPREEIAYNTIIARLFHSDGPGDASRSPSRLRR